MATSKITAKFDCDVREIWDIVTDFGRYGWRSDLRDVKILDENHFIEYSKSGYETKFSIKIMKFCERLELEIENENIKGHFVGLFFAKNNGSEIEFSEEIFAKKFFMKPFLSIYLKKQQRLYLSDLKKSVKFRVNFPPKRARNLRLL